MPSTAVISRPEVATRRTGYAIAMFINAVMFYLINVSPGWQVLPFLTDDTHLVLGFINASIGAGIVANAVYLVQDPPWLKALGEAVTTGVGLAAMVRLWQVFPFDFGPASVDWAFVARVVLVVSIIGAAIGVLVHLGRLVRHIANLCMTPPTPR
jgi:hypothetical protein